jgi:hypothetical protein
MRALFLLPPLLCLCLALPGCDSITRPASDGFEVGPGGFEKFNQDTQACQTEAEGVVNYDIRLVDTTRYARNRAFNQVYGQCMTARGHQPRPYLRNVLPAL